MERLSPQMEELLHRQGREGIYQIRDRRTVKGIIWRRNDPDALAQMILSNVGEEEVPLTLDGRKFMVRKVP